MLDTAFDKINKFVPSRWRWILQHAGFRKYFKNTGWMFLGRISTMVLSFLVSVYAARTLGVEEFGTLNFIISFFGIAGISFFVIDFLLIKKLNSEPENTDMLLGSALLIKLANSLLAILTATAAALFFTHDHAITILVLAFSTLTIFQGFNNVIDDYFQARADIKRISLVNILASIISSLIKIAVIAMDSDIVYLLLSYAFDQLVIATGYFYIYNKYASRVIRWRISYPIIKNFLTHSWTFSLVVITASIHMKVDQVFLKIFFDSSAVGVYAIAVRFSEVWFFISSIICMSLLPAILNAQKTDYAVFLSRSKRLYSLLFYLSIAICIIVFIFAPTIITLLYGSAYTLSTDILRIYIWSIIGSFVGLALQQFLAAQNKFKTILLLNSIGMLLSLSLGYLFIPIYGVHGAATINIIAYSLPFLIVLSMKDMADQRQSFIKAIFKPFSA